MDWGCGGFDPIVFLFVVVVVVDDDVVVVVEVFRRDDSLRVVVGWLFNAAVVDGRDFCGVRVVVTGEALFDFGEGLALTKDDSSRDCRLLLPPLLLLLLELLLPGFDTRLLGLVCCCWFVELLFKMLRLLREEEAAESGDRLSSMELLAIWKDRSFRRGFIDDPNVNEALRLVADEDDMVDGVAGFFISSKVM